MTSNESSTQRVATLIADERFAMLTTVADDGTLISRPMALQEVGFDGDLWFFAARDSRKMEHLRHDQQVNVTVSSADTWVSLTGRVDVIEDEARKRELWNPGVEAWFPEGPDSPEIVLLAVRGESAEYWDTPGGRVSTLLSFAKAKLTGEAYKSGDNEKVQL